mmetsp:Transcript_31369/g.67888  ORF Transcript_31369/g.67888 Transcript_31369/m.67888 type:complete len:132 (+) Transcript_31369:236-631(+)
MVSRSSSAAESAAVAATADTAATATSTATSIQLHPDQAAELQEAAEEFIRSCQKEGADDHENSDRHGEPGNADTARRRYDDDTGAAAKGRGGSGGAAAAAASASTGSSSTSTLAGRSFAFARSLLTRHRAN